MDSFKAIPCYTVLENARLQRPLRAHMVVDVAAAAAAAVVVGRADRNPIENFHHYSRRRTAGQLAFCGAVTYAPQAAHGAVFCPGLTHSIERILLHERAKTRVCC